MVPDDKMLIYLGRVDSALHHILLLIYSGHNHHLPSTFTYILHFPCTLLIVLFDVQNYRFIELKLQFIVYRVLKRSHDFGWSGKNNLTGEFINVITV